MWTPLIIWPSWKGRGHIYTIPTADIKDMRCILTMFDGDIVYEDPDVPLSPKRNTDIPGRERQKGRDTELTASRPFVTAGSTS